MPFFVYDCGLHAVPILLAEHSTVDEAVTFLRGHAKWQKCRLFDVEIEGEGIATVAHISSGDEVADILIKEDPF